MTPLLAAAVTGNTKIVEYLVARIEFTPGSRVEALQLIGATFVDKKRDLAGAVKFWKRALVEAEEGDKIAKEQKKIAADLEKSLKASEKRSAVKKVSIAVAMGVENTTEQREICTHFKYKLFIQFICRIWKKICKTLTCYHLR